MYPENIPYEKYIPDGWEGEFLNFLDMIPQKERYWKIDGINKISMIFKQETEKFKKGESYGKQ